MELANSDDGLPDPKSMVHEHVANFFNVNYGKFPSDSMIKLFVSTYLPSNYKQGKYKTPDRQFNLRTATQKPGPAPQYDQNAVIRNLMRLANTPDGLPEPKSALENLLRDWMLKEFGAAPGRTTIVAAIAAHAAQAPSGRSLALSETQDRHFKRPTHQVELVSMPVS